MKKAGIILLSITLLFCTFLVGFLLGRNFNRSQVTVSAPLSTAPPVTEVTTPSETQSVSFPLDINTATVEEFSALPGIGPVLARRIVDFRTQNGSFASISDLSRVEGIGEKRLEAILDYLIVGG